MKSFIAVFLSSLLAQTTFGLDAPIPGYQVVPFGMSVAATPGGEKLNLTGTIEEIHAQLLEINPNFDEDFGVKADAEPLVGRSLGKRFGPSCGGGSFNWGSADPGRIQEGINYLRGIAGQPYLGPGPGVCSRPSCSYNSAIWWCNDKRDIAVLPGFNTIADCAQVLKNACTIDGRTVGQNFNGGDWNCIIRGDSC